MSRTRGHAADWVSARTHELLKPLKRVVEVRTSVAISIEGLTIRSGIPLKNR